jgi:hypothetical protein
MNVKGHEDLKGFRVVMLGGSYLGSETNVPHGTVVACVIVGWGLGFGFWGLGFGVDDVTLFSIANFLNDVVGCSCGLWITTCV